MLERVLHSTEITSNWIDYISGREAAKLRNMIKQKKREHWSSFVEETTSNKAQDIWKVIKVARNPFNRRNTMPATLERKDTDKQKAHTLINQHFQGSPEAEIHNQQLQTMEGIQIPKEELVAKLLKALSTTNSHSTLGPDRISYRLLKLLKDSRLGLQVLGALADFMKGKITTLSKAGDGREITVVMIPK